ncbi:MAG: hypothetical protein WCS31_12300 [Verrucomicrobiae bacterium]
MKTNPATSACSLRVSSNMTGTITKIPGRARGGFFQSGIPIMTIPGRRGWSGEFVEAASCRLPESPSGKMQLLRFEMRLCHYFPCLPGLGGSKMAFRNISNPNHSLERM